MASLSTTRNYADGEVLVQADLDAFLDDIETFLNTTKLNDDNIQNSGITGSTKLLNQSVSESKLATGSVTTLKLGTDAVTTTKIADDAVTTAKILDANVTTAKIADSAVTTAKILDANVTTAKMANDSVTAAILADDAVTDANRAVTTDHVRDSAITSAKINTGAVTRAKLATYYTTGTVSTDAGWTNGEAKTLNNITVNGRPVLLMFYGGVIEAIGASVTVNLEYSADNVNWSVIKSIVALLTGGTDIVAFSRLTTDAGDCGAVLALHTPSAGTAYYRLLPSVSGGGTISINEAIQVLIQEL